MGFLKWVLDQLLGRSAPQPPAGTPRRVPMNPPSSPQASVPSTPRFARREPLKLDAGMFQPMSDAEALKRARGLGGRWGADPYLGRTDLIPPADNAWVKIIDAGMIAHGYLTAEQLAEIHKIGEQMDLVRPDVAQAEVEARRIGAQAKADREAIKAAKKAEAAAKRAARAAAVAKRRETDIAYLGRGVSAGLADRRSRIEWLRECGLPALSSPADVAAALGISVRRLRWLAYHSEAVKQNHYVHFTVPKKSGGMRTLSAPKAEMRRAQRWILNSILEPTLAKFPLVACAHGFARGRSTVTNAREHVGAVWVLNMDLKDFFPSVTFPRVAGLFASMGYSPAVATVLALLCTECPRREVRLRGERWLAATGPRAIPQGACTSPAISNLVARRLDNRLAGLAGKLGIRYTRYADDLTFSGHADSKVRERTDPICYLRGKVAEIAEAEGFRVHPDKTRVHRRNSAQMVTGIVVNEKPSVPREDIRRLRAILHAARTTGLAAQNRDNHPDFSGWVHGMVSYVHMVNPEQGAKLRAALAQVPRG